MLPTQAMLSNIGGTATLIGDPPNIIIGLKLNDYIGFIDFMDNLVPGVVAAVPACIYVMVLLYPKDLKGERFIQFIMVPISVWSYSELFESASA